MSTDGFVVSGSVLRGDSFELFLASDVSDVDAIKIATLQQAGRRNEIFSAGKM
jgi:hypothetical protein